MRTQPNNLSHSAFVSIANLGLERVERRIEVYADGDLREARTVTLEPQVRTDVAIDDIDDPDQPATVVEVRLASADEAATTAADPLALDDRAWAIVPPGRSSGRSCSSATATRTSRRRSRTCPTPSCTASTPAEYGPDTKPELFDLIIFEGALPAELPDKPILAIAPTAHVRRWARSAARSPTRASGRSTRTTRSSATSTSRPSTSPRPKRLEAPAWAKTVIPGPGGAPLLYAGTRDGLPTAVLAFEPRRSDLPLQVAFPVLLANLAGELLGGSATPADAVAPGAPVTLPIPDGAAGVRVERPDGSVDELVAPTQDASTVTFSRTDLLGVYTVTRARRLRTRRPRRPTAASAGARRPTAAPASPGASPTFRPADPDAPVPVRGRPARRRRVADRARRRGGADRPRRAGREPRHRHRRRGAPPVERPNARDELWIPIVLIALLVLTAEWLVYERDTLARLRRCDRRAARPVEGTHHGRGG